MSGPCSCNGKRYSTAYFTEPVKPTHAPLKALRNFISSPPVLTATRKSTMTKLANLECLGALSVQQDLCTSLSFPKCNQGPRHQMQRLLESWRDNNPERPYIHVIASLLGRFRGPADSDARLGLAEVTTGERSSPTPPHRSN